MLGQNVLFEARYADGQVDRLPDLAAELVVAAAFSRAKFTMLATKSMANTRPVVPTRRAAGIAGSPARRSLWPSRRQPPLQATPDPWPRMLTEQGVLPRDKGDEGDVPVRSSPPASP
jgi:hypothetical protein